MILIIKAARHKEVAAAQVSRLLLFDLSLSLHYCFLTRVLLEHLVPLP